VGAQWSDVEVVRTVFLSFSALAILQQVIMASHYWWRIIPLRKTLRHPGASGSPVAVLAPPIVWTFCYHLIVLGYLVWTSAGTYLAMANGFPHSPTVYFGPVLALGAALVTNRFMSYYSSSLSQAAFEKVLRDDAAALGPQ